MIDFKTHIELSKDIVGLNGSSGYLENLNPLERLEITRDIEATYPIENKSEVSDYIKNTFSVTDNVNECVLGQFIMLEQIVTGKTKFTRDYERDLAFAKLILRPKHHREFDNENPNDELENERMILASPVQDVYNAINKYLDDRDYVLFKQFAGVFYEVKDEDEEEVEEEQEEERTSENLFRQQWYWYSIVRSLAKEDITRYDEIYMLKMATVLPEMSYLAQKDKIDGANRRREQAMNKL